MKIGLYGKPNRNILTSFADGVLALGFSPVWQNPAGFSRMETQPFDFCAIWGGAGAKSKEVISTYEKFKIKTLVFEGGYVGENTHSIGIGHHYWLPAFKCPDDRINKFGLTFTKEQKKDGYILVIGQSAEINSVLAKKIQTLNTSHEIVFRPHPTIDFDIEGVRKIGGSLDEALAGAFAVVCETSNAAHRAMLKGIPVFCAKNAMYAECSNLDLTMVDAPHTPSDETLKDYFSRLTYAVWTVEEIKNGKALQFFVKVIKGNEPIFVEGKTESIKTLKGKFKGQTAYIVGKGPSLKYLTAKDFGGADSGIVITLNESIKIIQSANLDSRLQIFSMQKDGKPECMVKPNDDIPLVLNEAESKGWFKEHPERYIFDIKKDFNLEDNNISVIGGNCCSVIAAIEMAKLLGCKKIVFMCFDFLVNGDNGYPDNMGDLYKAEYRLENLKRMKEQVELHTRDIEHEFTLPEKKILPFTVITLTGDRPGAFRLCKRYLNRQTIQPTQWIVVDDGVEPLPKKDLIGIDYYRREPLISEPKHTLRLNMLEALKHVENDRVVVVEDDDWYRPDYLEISLKYLKQADLVGQETFFYWNLIKKSFHRVNAAPLPPMCLTAFTDKVFETLTKVCLNELSFILEEKNRDRIDSGSVDIFLWSEYKGKKLIYSEGDNVCVGIKGVPGRIGHTLGHVASSKNYFSPDLDLTVLKSLIGEDVKNYFDANGDMIQEPQEKKVLPFTVITLTGDRPEAFNLCKEYMARQTEHPAQWIVVDDGKKPMPKKDREGFEYHRRTPLKDDPAHTLRLNMLEALKHVKYDSVVIIEDDDWYRYDYIETAFRNLKNFDLVGYDSFYYWKVPAKAYKKIECPGRAAMCLTGFNKPVFKLLKMICRNSKRFIPDPAEQTRINKGFVDLSLWQRWVGSKKSFSDNDALCVGMKGLDGRAGLSLGHDKATKEQDIADTKLFNLDPNATMLKKLIGGDYGNYING